MNLLITKFMSNFTIAFSACLHSCLQYCYSTSHDSFVTNTYSTTHFHSKTFFFYKEIPMDNHESLIMESRDVKEASVEGVQRRTNPKKHFVSLRILLTAVCHILLCRVNNWFFERSLSTKIAGLTCQVFCDCVIELVP